MDNEGFWRSPEEWPEDDPPLPGWVRGVDGGWGEPDEHELVANETRWSRTAVTDEPEQPRESRQAQADKRAMLLVTGAIGGALMLLVGALILISQAGATDDEQSPKPPPTEPGVIYPAQTERDLIADRTAAAARQPAIALQLLDDLPDSVDPAPDAEPFDPDKWVAIDDGCLTIDERVLIDRSTIPIGWADEMECVPDIGRWTDRYLRTQIRRTIDAEVRQLVPAALAYDAGAWNWSAETRLAFVGDTTHPASHSISTIDTGHNPRSQGPADWRPARRSVWCAYAVDWIAIKSRWALGVTTSERLALDEMLTTCSEPDSDGADPATVVDDSLPRPDIALVQ